MKSYTHKGTDKLVSLVIKSDHKAPDAVRSSVFGCRNCLWASCECSFGSKYIPAEPVKTGQKTVQTCGCYTYYD